MADKSHPAQGRSNPPHATADCDVVMKGGITSGVIYPPLVARLAERFRLRNIGGTSAGAIAAAAAAAAQLGRLRGNADAFAALEVLPEELGGPGRAAGHSMMRELFQPSPETAAHFRVLTAAILRGHWARRFLRTLGALVRGYPLTALLGLLPGALLLAASARGGGVLGGLALPLAVLAGVLVLTIALALRFALSLLRTLPRHFYGLCTGMPQSSSLDAPPALTPWLADLLDSLAGKRPGQGPLTFGDLWGMRPDERARDPFPSERDRLVHLQMTTTCVTLGRPFTLPLVDRRFFFHPGELRQFFPERIVRWMEEHPRRPQLDGDPVVDGRVLPTFPAPADLPVVVAARMSSSFPVLLCAIPLWAVDYSRKHNRRVRREVLEGELDGDGDGDVAAEGAGLDLDSDPGADATEPSRRPHRTPADAEACWFSDGGVCSNFPVHFFDRSLPAWPTFGINLRPFHPDYRNRPVFLAARGGVAPEWWTRISPGLGGAPSFLATLLATMQDWRDNTQIGVHGYRERVAHISHHSSEGGLNLDMPREVISALGARGRLAADRLASAYDPDDPEGTWALHRWIRFRSTLAILEETLASFAEAYRERGYEALLTRGPEEPPRRYRMSAAQIADARELLARFLAVIESWMEFDTELFRQGAPRPQPELRITPRM